MSKIWKHFEVGRAEDGCKLGKCRMCVEPGDLRCSGGNTSSLWNHLKKNHNIEYCLIEKKSLSNPGNVKKVIGRQPTIANVISSKVPYGPNHPKQKQFDKNLKAQFIHDCLPFSMADSKYYRKTISELDPRIKVKLGRTYSKYVRNDEQKVKKAVKSLLRNNVKGVMGLTADMWDDRKQNSFCSVTCQFIDSDFKLHKATSAIKWFGSARHKSVNIAETLKKEIDEIKNESVLVVLVTDSTSNMVKTRELLLESDTVDEAQGCCNHKAQNAIKDGIKETPQAKRIITKAKKLAKYFRKSGPANNSLKAACQKTGHSYKRMKSSIDIRWNSEFDCFERLLYHQECIHEMDRKRQLDKASKYLLSRSDWRNLEEILNILKPVKIATKLMEGESDPTINRIAETMFDIDQQLNDKVKDLSVPPTAKLFAKKLKRSFQKRFPNFGLDDKTTGFANFLDPRLKGVHLGQCELLDSYKKSVVRAVRGYDGGSENNEVESENNNGKMLTPTEKLLKNQSNRLSEVFDDRSRGEKDAEKEIEVYLKLPACSKDEKVLDWWKAHSESLPRLSEFAKQILAIPASSSSSERLFSLAGLFDTVKRGRLRLETLEVLTLLKANKQLMEDFRIDIDNEETAATDSSASEEIFDEESGESESEGDISDLESDDNEDISDLESDANEEL